jgi:hypothetical protein
MTTIRIQTIQILANSDADCMPLRHNKWQTDFPITDPARIGVGYLVAPASFIFAPEPFALHDHHYTANNTPDASRANVTYQFTAPTSVRDLLVIQHTNGITEIEGLISDTGAPGSWQSIGIAKSRLVTDPATGTPPTGESSSTRPLYRTVARAIYPRNDQHDPYTVASQNSLMTRAGLVVSP